ncbi:MAG TPA: hypothetical protein VKG38_13490 [Solirubrobacteraceae bacterium]|nr:hypothetical protein [Solirubrobacteraceae bacterium]
MSPVEQIPNPVSASPSMRRRSSSLPSGVHVERRRRCLHGVDWALALLAAAAALLIAPGLAIVALAALLVLAGCCASLIAGRRHSGKESE